MVELSSDLSEEGWSDQLMHGAVEVLLHLVLRVLFEDVMLEYSDVVKYFLTNMTGVGAGCFDLPMVGGAPVDLFHVQL